VLITVVLRGRMMETGTWYHEETPTPADWKLLQGKEFKQYMKGLWMTKKNRAPPVLIEVPPMRRGDGRSRNCVSNCTGLFNAKKHAEIRFGLKVFVAKNDGDHRVVGIKGVVHAVVFDNDTGLYTDPSPEEDESRIMFIHIPTMYSPEQQTVILSNPSGVRMGSVIIGLDQQSAYEQIVRMNPLDNYLGRQCTADLDLFLVNEDNTVLRVEEDGTLTAMMD
jgi:hypothetical protein